MGCFGRLNWWPETPALVEKIEHLQKSSAPYGFCLREVDCVCMIFLKLLFQSYKY